MQSEYNGNGSSLCGAMPTRSAPQYPPYRELTVSGYDHDGEWRTNMDPLAKDRRGNLTMTTLEQWCATCGEHFVHRCQAVDIARPGLQAAGHVYCENCNKPHCNTHMKWLRFGYLCSRCVNDVDVRNAFKAAEARRRDQGTDVSFRGYPHWQGARQAARTPAARRDRSPSRTRAASRTRTAWQDSTSSRGRGRGWGPGVSHEGARARQEARADGGDVRGEFPTQTFRGENPEPDARQPTPPRGPAKGFGKGSARGRAASVGPRGRGPPMTPQEREEAMRLRAVQLNFPRMTTRFAEVMVYPATRRGPFARILPNGAVAIGYDKDKVRAYAEEQETMHVEGMRNHDTVQYRSARVEDFCQRARALTAGQDTLTAVRDQFWDNPASLPSCPMCVASTAQTAPVPGDQTAPDADNRGGGGNDDWGDAEHADNRASGHDGGHAENRGSGDGGASAENRGTQNEETPASGVPTTRPDDGLSDTQRIQQQFAKWNAEAKAKKAVEDLRTAQTTQRWMWESDVPWPTGMTRPERPAGLDLHALRNCTVCSVHVPGAMTFCRRCSTGTCGKEACYVDQVQLCMVCEANEQGAGVTEGCMLCTDLSLPPPPRLWQCDSCENRVCGGACTGWISSDWSNLRCAPCYEEQRQRRWPLEPPPYQ